MTDKSALCLIRIIASIFFMSFFIACAAGTNIKISKHDLVAIESISIDPDVEVPKIPYVQGQNMNKYGWLGGIGAATGANKDSEIFQKYLDDNNIKMSEIVLERFQDAINQKGLFKINDNNPIKLKLKVGVYGFGVAGVFDHSNVEPLLNITATLIANKTNIIWRKRDYIGTSDVTAYPFEKLIKEPDLVIRLLSEATNVVAEKILSDLENDK